MKKIIILTLVLFLLFIMTPNTVNAKSQNTSDSTYSLANQFKSVAEYKQILEKSKTYSNFDEEFGGVYLDSNQNLVVNVLRGHKANFINKLDIPSNVIIREVNYSKKDLKEVRKTIEKHMSDYGISEIYLSETDNSIVIRVYNNFEKNSKFIKELAKIDNLEIINDEGRQAAVTSGDVINGDYIYNGPTGFTSGVAARNSAGMDGIVTVGHIITDGIDFGDPLFYQGSLVGYRWAAIFGGSADGAFFRLTNGWSPTHELKNGSYTESYSRVTIDPSCFMVGLGVNKYGEASGKTTGHITAIGVTANFTIDGNNYTVNNTVLADYECGYGDSGGPVTYWVWTGSSVERYVMGIQSYAVGLGNNGEWLPDSLSGFSRVDYIAAAINITYY